MIKCELIIGGYSYKITDDVMNWDDVTISLKRGNYDGIVRSFSSKFEFVNTAYSLLKKQYRDNYLGAAASIVISRRNNSWTWNESFRCTLDFSTYEDSGRIISINAVDNTLAAIIKAKKSVQYEYPVADLNPIVLNCDRLEMKSLYSFIPYQYDNEKENQDEYDFDETREFPAQMRELLTFPLMQMSSEITPDAEELVETNSVYNLFPNRENVYSLDYIFKNISKDKNVEITISLDFTFNTLNDKRVGLNLIVWKPVQDGKNETVGYISLFPPIASATMKGTRNMTVPAGCYFVCCFQKNSPWDELKVRISNFKNFSISLNAIGKPVNIDIISKSSVANAIFESMTGNKSTSVEIMPDTQGELTRLNTTYIMAAESVRGIPNAKLYTSFKKYCDWMEAEFGYVYIIDKNIVRFLHRDKLFTNSEIKDLGSNINDFQYSVNSSLIYSSVKVGYDKQDYDSINGRDEFRFINEFTTGITLTDNTLSLISPYRADAYGIEFLAQKRGKNTTDNDSDNDVFFVSCHKDGGITKLYRPYQSNQLSGLISPETMFNLQYSPRFMLEANKSYIAACTGLLKFTSSNGNSDVSIVGVKETDDMTLGSRLFTVGEVEVETSDIDAPEDLTGLVTLDNNSEIIRGYIKQLKINTGKEESVKYSLIVKDIKS